MQKRNLIFGMPVSRGEKDEVFVFKNKYEAPVIECFEISFALSKIALLKTKRASRETMN